MAFWRMMAFWGAASRAPAEGLRWLWPQGALAMAAPVGQSNAAAAAGFAGLAGLVGVASPLTPASLPTAVAAPVDEQETAGHGVAEHCARVPPLEVTRRLLNGRHVVFVGRNRTREAFVAVAQDLCALDLECAEAARLELPGPAAWGSGRALALGNGLLSFIAAQDWFADPRPALPAHPTYIYLDASQCVGPAPEEISQRSQRYTALLEHAVSLSSGATPRAGRVLVGDVMMRRIVDGAKPTNLFLVQAHADTVPSVLDSVTLPIFAHDATSPAGSAGAAGGGGVRLQESDFGQVGAAVLGCLLGDAAESAPSYGAATRQFPRPRRPPPTLWDGAVYPETGGVPFEKTIWMFWAERNNTGVKALQHCIQSWGRLNPAWRVRIVTLHTVEEYVDPRTAAAIRGLRHQRQHQSDLFRVAMLAAHGGVYADVDVYCVLPLDKWLPAKLAPTGFFAFRLLGEPRGRILSVWFLAAVRDNPVAVQWLASVRAEAETQLAGGVRRLTDYFSSSYRFADLVQSDSHFRALWRQTPAVNSTIMRDDLCCVPMLRERVAPRYSVRLHYNSFFARLRYQARDMINSLQLPVAKGNRRKVLRWAENHPVSILNYLDSGVYFKGEDA